MAEEDGSSNAGLAIGVVALVVALVLSAVVTGLCCLWCRAKKKLVYLGEFLCLEPVVCFNPLTMPSVYIHSMLANPRRRERIYTLILVFIAYRMLTWLTSFRGSPY